MNGVIVGSAAVALPCDGTVPLKAMGFQRGNNLVTGPGLFTGRVNVLDPQEPLSIVAPRLEIARDGGQE